MKGAVLVLLGVVLIAVWAPMILGGKARSTSAAPSSDTAARGPSGGPAKWKEKPEGVEAPELTLAQATAYDPFATPEWSPHKKAVATAGGSDSNSATPGPVDQERFETLRDQGLAMVVVSSGVRRATIGDVTVSVGDEIDGFRVVEINDNGVVLTPAQGRGEGGGRAL